MCAVTVTLCNTIYPALSKSMLSLAGKLVDITVTQSVCKEFQRKMFKAVLKAYYWMSTVQNMHIDASMIT